MTFIKLFTFLILLALSPCGFAESPTETTKASEASTESEAEATPVKPNSEPVEKRTLKGYRYGDWELRTAPVAFLVRWYTLDASYIVSDKFSMGPSLILFNNDSSDRNQHFGRLLREGTAVGLNMMHYIRSAQTHTPYLSFHAYYEDYRYGHISLFESELAEVKGVRLNSAFGYRWRWSAITVLVGGGLEVTNQEEVEVRTETNGSRTERTFSDNDFDPFVEAKFGVIF